ncbi:MAG TPA: TIGR01212 family radical SAM protein [Paludibacteraceae bacterium]|nr:TIGR01212 family radical SAM protein [Paludibacteraceae bacterium]HQB69527.1 TIGR01212 family radical SAM protein [Paludibacteraceae bacterium]
MLPRINYYNSLLKHKFDVRVQKISINAGFTCPNRDGSKGVGGCTYCNNQTFNPEYCFPTKSVSEQIEEGIRFFYHKYQTQRYLAYFQAYTNTYGDLENLKEKYEEALAFPQVVGVVIGTRPDCITDELLDYFAELSKHYYVMIEYGVESTSNETLKFINRGHNFETSVEAIRKTAERGIFVGAHLILGLPFESRDVMIGHAKQLSQLPLTMLKLHQLQIVKGTKMAQQFVENSEWFSLFSLEGYIDLAIDFVTYLSPDIAVERFVSQSPKELLLAPSWGIKNFEFADKINKRIVERDLFHGQYYK